uniref:Uncharacterized protein n=1 Tax=Anguilla anguilla TaxID=7936 RepID=A0A0E9WDM6_ANGAN
MDREAEYILIVVISISMHRLRTQRKMPLHSGQGCHVPHYLLRIHNR